MHMHNPKSRRKDLFWRTVIYLVMTLAVLALMGLSLFLVLGYSVDNKGRAEQGGLIQFRSFPEGATVKIDGGKLGSVTPAKSNATAGQHNVTMERKDYRGWSKNFTLGKGELLWLNALLVPKSITTNESYQFNELTDFVASPDKKWIAAIEKSNEPNLKIIDIRDEKKPKVSTLNIPSTALKAVAPNDTFSIAEWDFGSKYLLVKHTSGQTTEWLRLDRSDESKARNISRDLAISQAHFVGNSGNIFYVLNDGMLRKINIEDDTLPSPIAENVKEFQLYKDNRVGFVRTDGDRQIVEAYQEGNEPREVASIKGLEPNIHVALTSYFDDDYIAYTKGAEARLIKNPFSSHPESTATLSIGSNIDWLFFSNNGQFLVIQQGVSMASYDIERNMTTRFSIPGQSTYTRTNHLEWLDDFHLWSDNGGVLSILEFDGANAEVIGNVSPGFDVTLSDNGKRLFSVGSNETTKKPVLQSSVMVLE